MSLRQTIVKNTFIQVLGKVMGMVLSLIAVGMTFRYLHDDGFGRYTAVLSFLQFFGTMMDLGLYIILIKKIARIDERSTPWVNTIFTLRIFSGVVFLSIAPFTAWILGHAVPLYANPEIFYGILITTLFYFFISMNQLLSAVYQKFLNTSWIAVGEFVGKLTMLLATIAMISLDLGFLWILGVLVISSGVNFLINFIGTRKFIHLKLHWDMKIVKEIFKEAWPIALSIGLVLIYFKGDILLLTLYNTPDEIIGWYGAPYKLLEVLITFPAMFTGLVLPIVTAAWQTRDSDRFQRVLQLSFDALAIIAIPMVFGIATLAPLIMHLLAGPDFGNSIPILRILVIATFSIFITTLFGYMVPALNQQKKMLVGYAFVAVTAFIGYLILIPRYSIYGAAWTTVYAETMVLLISMFIVFRTARVSLHYGTLLKSVLSAGGMFLVLWVLTPLIQQITLPRVEVAAELIILTVIGAAVYAVLMLLTKGLQLHELKSLIRSK